MWLLLVTLFVGRFMVRPDAISDIMSDLMPYKEEAPRSTKAKNLAQWLIVGPLHLYH